MDCRADIHNMFLTVVFIKNTLVTFICGSISVLVGLENSPNVRDIQSTLTNIYMENLILPLNRFNLRKHLITMFFRLVRFQTACIKKT